MFKRKRKIRERSLFDRPRRFGLLAGMGIGLVMAGAGVYNVAKEVASWESSFTSNIDAIVEGTSTDRFAVSPPASPGDSPLRYHIYYGTAGTALAFSCAIGASVSRNRGYSPLPKADLKHVSYAQKNESGRLVVRVRKP